MKPEDLFKLKNDSLKTVFMNHIKKISEGLLESAVAGLDIFKYPLDLHINRSIPENLKEFFEKEGYEVNVTEGSVMGEHGGNHLWIRIKIGK